MSRRGSRIGRAVVRAERAIVGAFMRVIAVVAERRVRRSLEEGAKPAGRSAVHVDLEDRF